MAALYPGTSVSGYNSNPPPDDGSTGSTNLITWNTDVKAKIGDPLNTFASSVDSNVTSAFGKTIDGAAVLAEGVNYQVQAGDQGKLVKATASGITITTPDATSVGAPFMFAVNNQSSGTITIAGANPGVQQNIDGAASQIVQQGGSCIVKTDGTNWFTIGLKPATNALGGNNYGFTDTVNANILCSVATNLLTVALKTKAGNDPSVADPVLVPFRDTTLGNGDPVWLTITSALSINTNATGATLGSQNALPFRFWVLLFNNGGTPVLALWQSGAGSSALAINPLNEGTLQSTTGISAAATSAGVFYTPNGTSLSSKAFRILGYLEYTGGLTTAGTYASTPGIVQLFGPGIKKPGDVVQTVYATSTAQTQQTSATKLVTTPTAVISPTSTANLVLVRATGTASPTAGNHTAFVGLGRNSNANLFGTSTNAEVGSTGTVAFPCTVEGLDAPATTSSTTYGVYIAGDGSNTFSWNLGSNVNTSTIVAQEIQA